MYEARRQMIDTGEGVDWGFAEALAFGTLLSEGGLRIDFRQYIWSIYLVTIVVNQWHQAVPSADSKLSSLHVLHIVCS